jgi:phytol kinase
VLSTLLFWRNSLAGVVVISVMCGGDGLADIVGRTWGREKLPWNARKSWLGSAAMLGGSLAMCLGCVRRMHVHCTCGNAQGMPQCEYSKVCP